LPDRFKDFIVANTTRIREACEKINWGKRSRKRVGVQECHRQPVSTQPFNDILISKSQENTTNGSGRHDASVRSLQKPGWQSVGFREPITAEGGNTERLHRSPTRTRATRKDPIVRYTCRQNHLASVRRKSLLLEWRANDHFRCS
jgi:hypothetical protein